MGKPNYKLWLRQDLWRIWEFVYIACEFDPILREDEELVHSQTDPDSIEWLHELYAPCRRLSDEVNKSIASGCLPVSSFGNPPFDAAKPIDLIHWAMSRGIDIPDELEQFADAKWEEHSKKNGIPPFSKRELRKRKTMRFWRKLGDYWSIVEKGHPKWPDTRISEEIAKYPDVDIKPATIRRHTPRK